MTKTVPLVRTMALLSLVCSHANLVFGISVREENGGNCIGVRSCRPRCITFKIDREVTDCNERSGGFNLTSGITPWNVIRFQSVNCESAGTCVNNKCGKKLSKNLAIRMGETGYTGSRYYTFLNLNEGEDLFTFCSIYPCPKDECALPEQMGSRLQLDFIEGRDVTPETYIFDQDQLLLSLEIHLKAAFLGPVLGEELTRFGPLSVLWIDDPTGCRRADYSECAPAAPPANPMIFTDGASTNNEVLYCSGESYAPSPLPCDQGSPQSWLNPTSTPVPALTTSTPLVADSQVRALKDFFDSTGMAFPQSRGKHNWFIDGNDPHINYCSFPGVACDDEGYVIIIELNRRGLTGFLPTSMGDFVKLRRLEAQRNDIGGSIPISLASLTSLRQIELGNNKMIGMIPPELGSLPKLRRIMLQHNELVGTIPSSLCDIESLAALDLSGNSGIKGELPSCFGIMNLIVLRIDDVGLIGEVPPGLCGLREMNGLYPNNFGCDAIACRAGTFQIPNGRQSSNETACIPCSTPSNVLGSTSCFVLDNDSTVTTHPTETMTPNAPPSVAPVEYPRPTPAFPSTSPSAMPSQQPGLSPGPGVPTSTFQPSSASNDDITDTPTSLWIIETANFLVQFESVKEMMDEHTVGIFEQVTQDFIRQTIPLDTHVAIRDVFVTVVSQQLMGRWNDTVKLLHIPARLLVTPFRSLNGEDVLTVEMVVGGETTSSQSNSRNITFEESVLHGFRHNMTLLTKALANASSLFDSPNSSGKQPDTASTSSDVSPKVSQNNNKVFLSILTAVGVFSCVVVAVFFLHQHQIKRYRAADYSVKSALGINPRRSELQPSSPEGSDSSSESLAEEEGTSHSTGSALIGVEIIDDSEHDNLSLAMITDVHNCHDASAVENESSSRTTAPYCSSKKQFPLQQVRREKTGTGEQYDIPDDRSIPYSELPCSKGKQEVQNIFTKGAQQESLPPDLTAEDMGIFGSIFENRLPSDDSTQSSDISSEPQTILLPPISEDGGEFVASDAVPVETVNRSSLDVHVCESSSCELCGLKNKSDRVSLRTWSVLKNSKRGRGDEEGKGVMDTVQL